MPTGLHPDTLTKFITGLTISSIALYVDPESAHLFLSNGVSHVGILTFTTTDEGLNIDLLANAPHSHRDEFDPYRERG